MPRLKLIATLTVTAAAAAALLAVTPTARAEKGEGSIRLLRQLPQGQPASDYPFPDLANMPRQPFNFFGQLLNGQRGSAANYQAEQLDQGDPEPGPPPGKNPDDGFDVYQPERVVPIADANLSEPLMFGSEPKALYAALRDGTAAVKVTESQRRAIIAFYVNRRFAPLWTSSSGLSGGAKDVLALLSRADDDGLEARDYLPPSLGSYDSAADFQGDAAQMAAAEVEITAQALRYARHASGGRIIPNRMSGYYDITPPAIAPAAALEELARADDPAAFLASLEPTLPAYGEMKRKLAELRGKSEPDGSESAAEEEELAAIPPGPRVKPGQSDPRIPLLRQHLAKLGLMDAPEAPAAPIETALDAAASVDAPADQPETSADTKLDAKTADALKAYQKSKGLKVSGALDKATIAALGGATKPKVIDTQEQIERLVLNMERLRWLPRDLGPRYIFANQAAFELRVMNDGAEEWRTKVIVGKPDTQTYVFNDEMEMVVFNPTWGVPGSIIAKEMLPELLRDPAYLDKKGFEVVDAKGQVVPSRVIDWSRYAANGRVPYGVRQPAGGDNALGEVKFLFPNAHDIYMHDTPMRELFKKDVRAFSHGCVRVENPRRFAEVVLGWDSAKVDAAIESRQSQTVPLPKKIPVYLTYFTAWPDESGRIAFHDDIYGRDARLKKALETLAAATQ